MSRYRRLAVASVLAAASSPAVAGSHHLWLTPTSGPVDAPERWFGGVPGAADTAEFGLLAGSTPFVVQFPADVPFGALLVEDQQPIFQLEGHELNVAGSITVGGFDLFETELSLYEGLTQAHQVVVGDRPGSGSLDIDWALLAVDVGEGDVLLATDPLAEASLSLSGPDSPFGIPATLYAGDVSVGVAGEARLEVSQFGYLECNGSLSLGVAPGSRGTLLASTGALLLAEAILVGGEGQGDASFNGATAVANQLVLGGNDAAILLQDGAQVNAETFTTQPGPLSFLSISDSVLTVGDFSATAAGDTVVSLDNGVLAVEREMLVPPAVGLGSVSIFVAGPSARILGAEAITLGTNGPCALRVMDRGGVITNGVVTLGAESFAEFTLSSIPSIFVGCDVFVAGGELAIGLESGMPPPPPGTSVTLVAANVIVGSFRSVSLDPGMVGSVIYHANEIVFVAAAPQLGDLTGDGVVGPADLSVLLGDWGLAGSIADLNNDGLVSAADLAILLAEWG